MGPGGAVWGKKTENKKSRETVPLTEIVGTQISKQIIFYGITYF